MATLAAIAARRAATLARAPASQPVSLISRRGFSGAADHHGPSKVNCWQEPMNPGQWKEEQFVIVSLTGWGLAIYGAYKFFTRGKGKKEEKVPEASH